MNDSVDHWQSSVVVLILQHDQPSNVLSEYKERRIYSVFHLKNWKSSAVDVTASKGYFCAYIPYGKLMLGGTLCTCLWDILLHFPRDGQLLQK